MNTAPRSSSSGVEDEATAQISDPLAHDWARMLTNDRRSSLVIFADPAGTGLPDGQLVRLATALGFRLLDAVPLASALSRLDRLVDVDAAILACSGNEPDLDRIVGRLDRVAAGHGTALLVIVGLDGLDLVDAVLETRSAVLLCQPSEPELISALMSALSPKRQGETLHDIGPERENDQIERLNEQLVRLNQTIEALIQNRLPAFSHEAFDRPDPALHAPARGYTAMENGKGGEDTPVSSHQVRALLRARRLREQLLAADLFADPAWDIMLDLMAARLEHRQVSVSSLCIAAAVPPTTALRWIRNLTDIGLLQRHADPHDGRRIFIGLSDHGANAIQHWFRESRAHLMAALGLRDGGLRTNPKLLA